MQGLGIDLRLFLYQLANFGLLLFGLTYFLHKPLLKLLDSRKREVKESLKNAERLREEMAALEARQKKVLDDAHKAAAHLLTDAKQQATELKEQINEQAHTQAQEILQKAAQDLETEKATMKQELRGELAELVVKASQKVLSTGESSDVQAIVKELS